MIICARAIVWPSPLRATIFLWMLYCSRTRTHAAWLGAIQALEIPLTLHFDSEQGGPPDLDAFIAALGPHTRYYCCDPSPMLRAFEHACERYAYSHAHIATVS